MEDLGDLAAKSRDADAWRPPMRFGLIDEACVPHGVSFYQRYREMIDEAVLAEEMGFDFWGSSEHHHLVDIGISSPEVFFAAVAQHTSRIRLRHMVRLALSFNHPLRIAEQTATLDLVSNGRVDLGLGRSNQEIQLDAFEVDPGDTREQMMESLEVIMKAFSGESFTHKGKNWTIETPVHLTPRPLQTPHPPIFLSATSETMHKRTGELGLGLLSWDKYMGWDRAEKHARLYKEAIAEAPDQVSPLRNDNLSFLVIPAFCAETEKEAREKGAPIALEFIQMIVKVFPSLANRSSDYDYMREFAELEKYQNDIDFFLENSPGLMVGTPDHFVKQIRRLHDIGYDEVILRIDGAMEHDDHMRAIKMIGEEVIPEVKNPLNVVRSGLFPKGALP